MQNKPIAKTDYTYCVNDKCKEKDYCARYSGNYNFDENRLYSFCNFNLDNCIESEKNKL